MSQKERPKGYLPNFSELLNRPTLSLGTIYSKKELVSLLETVIRVDKPRKNVLIPELAEDLDGLGYLQGKRC